MLADIHFLLRPGGALLMGFAPLHHPPQHAAIDELIRLALRAGFSGRGARLHIGSSNLVNHALPLFTFYGKD